MVGKYDTAKLKDIKLVNDMNSYYLDVTYEYENEYGVYELNIPRIHLPISTHILPSCGINMSGCYGPNNMNVNLGFGELNLFKDLKTGITHKITEIKKKPRKMTLAEVEAALGHKVELVSE